MDMYKTMQFYANIWRRSIVYTASLSPSALQKRAIAFHRAVAVLPKEPASDEDYAMWFAFFRQFGTHYVKKVSFGGVMRLTTFINSKVKEDKRIKKNNWNFYLQARFARLAGIKFDFGSNSSEDFCASTVELSEMRVGNRKAEYYLKKKESNTRFEF